MVSEDVDAADRAIWVDEKEERERKKESKWINAKPQKSLVWRYK